MGTPFIGEIRMFGGNYAPAGWSFCDGALIPISENDALFALIGTTYGGDGQSTFALPDLRGRVPIHQGPLGSASFIMGQRAGVETVTLMTQQIPAHSHPVRASSDAGSSVIPAGNIPAGSAVNPYTDFPGSLVQMGGQTIGPAGGNQPHENMAPFQCVNFIISLFGIFPQRA